MNRGGKHLNIWIDEEVYTEIKADADKNYRSVTKEIEYLCKIALEQIKKNEENN